MQELIEKRDALYVQKLDIDRDIESLERVIAMMSNGAITSPNSPPKIMSGKDMAELLYRYAHTHRRRLIVGEAGKYFHDTQKITGSLKSVKDKIYQHIKHRPKVWKNTGKSTYMYEGTPETEES